MQSKLQRTRLTGFFWSLAWVIAAGGCTEAIRVDRLTSRIEASPSPLVLPAVPVSVRSQAPLTIASVGSLPLGLERLRFEGDDVFGMVGNPPAALAPNGSEAVLVTAQADSVGVYTGTLVIAAEQAENPELRIPVQFQVIDAPVCDDGNTCTTDRFNTETNACENTFADGIPCQPADRCIIDAVCQQGVCLGSPKTCDDQNACTRDVCRQIDGQCLFLEDTNICDDDNDCTADSCDENGCQNDPINTGLACDDGDTCTDRDTCFDGRCVGRAVNPGGACDDGNSCTVNDICVAGVCSGESIVAPAAEGDIVFRYPLETRPERAFLHRRHVSMSDDGVFFGLDHFDLANDQGLIHVVFSLEQCGTAGYNFAYTPPDPFVSVAAVRRALQVFGSDVRMVVGVRQLPENGFQPQTTAYVLDEDGVADPNRSVPREVGGETGRSLLPDGSQIWGTVVPTNDIPTLEEATQNLVVVRADLNGTPLWTYSRSSDWWAEFLGVAGPRVLFWSQGRFGAVDFNTGALVWSQPTAAITQEIALSTQLDLGVARSTRRILGGQIFDGQILGVEVLNGNQVFSFPDTPDAEYVPRTDPVISADGRILFMMERRVVTPDDGSITPVSLSWVELDTQGQVIVETRLPYTYPADWRGARAIDSRDDPYPTVADDGVAYVGYGDRFWAIDPGGRIRWTLSSTITDAFTATVPLLRGDGIMLISRGGREIIGVRTNGGLMSDEGWASYRHDNNRTNFTP